MSKIVVSAFNDPMKADTVLRSAISGGLDSQLFSLVNPMATDRLLDSVMYDVPAISARMYRKHLRKGDSLFIARVSEEEVSHLIKILQTTGGHHIEAFDMVEASPGH
jgi:hypothetical protein